MRLNFSLVLGFLFSALFFLVAATPVLAGPMITPAFLQGWLPVIGSGAAGIIFTLIGLIPAIRGVGFNFMDAATELNKFIAKYKDLFAGEVKVDFFKVLYKFDFAFESLATIMGKVGAKKLSTFLSDIIKQDWYQEKRTV